MTTISFIILNYNCFHETYELVNKMLSWDLNILDFSIIIVDNCSNDDSYLRLKEAFSEYQKPIIDIIQSPRNGGYSYGNNIGVKHAVKKYSPEFIAISNPDVVIEQETVIQLLSSFSYDSRIGMCAPVMKAADGSYQVYSQLLPTYLDDLCACIINKTSRTIINEIYKTLEDNDSFIITEMLPGSFFIIRSDCFLDIGMLDEKVFLYCEERILGKKLKDAGYIAILRSDLFYIHMHAVSTSKSMNRIKRWSILLKSRLYYQRVYLRVGPIRLGILRVAMFLFILQLQLLSLIKGKNV